MPDVSPPESPPAIRPRPTGRPTIPTLRGLMPDLTASIVVFLVAVPLCVGIAVASGVPAELGLITGIVGGLVTGFLPGSSLQVSGPAAGLTVLIFEAVQHHGVRALGALVLAAGCLQVVMGLLRWGRCFRAISLAVVQGMLAGIGVVLIAGQTYALVNQHAPAGGIAKLIGLPGALLMAITSSEGASALAVGAGVLAVLLTWKRLPKLSAVLPAPLVGVGLAVAAVALFDLPIATVKVEGLLASIQPPGGHEFAGLLSLSTVGTVIAIALIASAESLFSAAAVDRLHDGPRTDYNKELVAQGVGNVVCGGLGALPMTAVIVRSAANVQAGARTRASRVLHGVWLLLFAAVLPSTLELVPIAALAAVLIHAGCKLVPVATIRRLVRVDRSEAAVLLVTTTAIVTTNLFEGVLVGLTAAVAKAAWDTSHVHLEVDPQHDEPSSHPTEALRVTAVGNATFLRLPTLLDQLEALPQDRPVTLDLSGLRHLDHACHAELTTWADRRAG